MLSSEALILPTFTLASTIPSHSFSKFILLPTLPLLSFVFAFNPFSSSTDTARVLSSYGLRIDKTLYGLKEAGKLSNLRLVQLLSSYDFVETSTPCLFRHKTRPITFCLDVDDFGVKYQHRADFDFLVTCLSNL